MAASVALLGWDEEPIRVVQDVDWVLDDRADSTNQLRVTTSLAEADGVDAEQEVIFKGRRFTVADIDRDRAADTAVIVADEAQAALADVVIVDFKPNNWSLTRAMNAVLEGTRWTLGEVTGTRYGQAHFDEITALDALHFLARHQDAHLSFDSLRRRVNITQNHGTAHEYVFTYGRQLSNIRKEVQQPVTTVIYPTMAEDVELPVVEDYGYYLSQGLALSEAKARFRKEEYWEDSRYEIAENMTRDAQKRLEEEAWPSITYTLTAQATLDVEGVDDFDLSELHLGDTVYVWDQETDTKLSAEVTAVTTSSDQSENELVLSTLPASLGDSVSGRGYFGDSGRPSSGGPRRSGPQPRPSMPILEQMGDYGIAVTRWNGQDHDGNYNTIPQRFGTLLTLVAPLEDGVIPSPMDSSHTFMGSDIQTRGGGTSTIGFNGYGEFAIWHQMRGWDGETMSQLSEPLVVDVPPVFDPEPLKATLEDLNENRLPALRDRLDTIEPVIEDYDDRIQAAHDGAESARNTAETLRDETLPVLEGELQGLTAGQQALTTNLEDLDTRVGPALETSISEAVSEAQSSISDFRTEWDENWDPEAISGLVERADDLEVEIQRGLAEADVQVQRFAVSGSSGNLFTDSNFETFPDGDSHWVVLSRNGSWVVRDIGELDSDESGYSALGMNAPSVGLSARAQAEFYPLGDRGVPAEGGQEYVFRAEVWPTNNCTLRATMRYRESRGGTQIYGLDGAWVTGGGRQWYEVRTTAPDGPSELSVEFQVREGSTGWANFINPSIVRQIDGKAVIDGTLLARHVDMEDFTADAGFIDNAFVNLIQGKMANFDEALIGGTLLKDGAISASKLTIIPATEDFAPDPGRDPELWELVGASINTQGSSSNPSGRWFQFGQRDGDTQIRGPYRPVTAGQQIYFNGFYTWGGNWNTGATVNVRMEWFADENSTRLGYDTFTSVESGFGGHWVEGYATVPEDAALGRLYLYQASTDGPGSAGFWGSIQCHPIAEGKLIVQGLLQATTAELQELFFDTAVGNVVAAGSAEFLELDAGKITSGKINTARLDAQEVAGAVANFLTLDALEINVDQLAGEIANIIEITAESIQAGAIGTRHLAIADFENLLNEDALWDFREHGLNSLNWQVATGSAAGWLTFTGEHQGPIVLRYDASGHASGTSGDSGLRYAATGNGVTVNPGDQFHISADTWVNSGSAGYLRFRARYTDEDGNNVSWQDIGDITTSSTAHSWEVPDNDLRRRMFLVFWADQGGTGNAHIGRIRFRRKSGGELIVDGGIKARNLDVEEIFFDQAVGNTVAAGVGEFLELNADQIRSNSWTGIVATGATFQTHAAADRGVKMTPAGLRGWDSNGNLNFDVSASTGNILATGTFRTSHSGSRVELYNDSDGGRLEYHHGQARARMKLMPALNRLELVYNAFANETQERPHVGVEENRAFLGYRQTQVEVGGTTQDNQGIRFNGSILSTVSFDNHINMQRAHYIRWHDANNRYIASMGQNASNPTSSGLRIWLERGALRIENDGVFIPRAYQTTSSTDANVFVSSSGWLSRATSASRYKLDQQEMTVPDSVLDIPMIDWVDKAQTEFKAEMDAKPRPFTAEDQAQYDTIDLRRVPGVVAETVEAYGGEQFVNYGPDGQVEEVMYPRLALAQVQVLKRKHDALEQRVRELEGAA